MISQINKLLHNDALYPITPNHLSDKDLWVIKRDGKKVVGFVWAGLMANGTVAYVDKFVVHPEYRGKGVGQKLTDTLFALAQARGVKECHAFIKQGRSHDASAINSLKMAMGADQVPYTYISGQIQYMQETLAERS